MYPYIYVLINSVDYIINQFSYIMLKQDKKKPHKIILEKRNIHNSQTNK